MASQEVSEDRRSPPEPRPLLADAGGRWVRHWTGEDWIASADAWARARLTAAGIGVSGEPVPYKIRFWAAVWCYPTDHGLFWFKENNPGQAFEAGLVAADTVHAIGDWFGELGADHPLRLDSVTLDGVRQAGDALGGWSARLTGAVPMALDQNDLHVRNVFSSHPSAPFRFFDFGDAVWGHPFATLSCVRAALVDAGDGAWAEDDPRLDELADAYLGEWSDLAPLDVLRRELEVAHPLHAVHRLVSWHRLLVHADELEAGVWAASPRYWLGEVVRLFAAE